MCAEKSKCPTCAGEISSHGHMCVPLKSTDEKCDWCGSFITDQRHMCNSKVQKLAYICNSCGRTAVKAEHLCRPEKIK